MTLNTIFRPTDDYLVLEGTTTNNSVVEIQLPGDNRGKVRKEGSGTWTLGDAYGNEFRISDGILIVNGEITTRSGFTFLGGEFHYNNAGALGADSRPLYFSGGSLDNSSGAGITASYTSSSMTWSND